MLSCMAKSLALGSSLVLLLAVVVLVLVVVVVVVSVVVVAVLLLFATSVLVAVFEAAGRSPHRFRLVRVGGGVASFVKTSSSVLILVDIFGVRDFDGYVSSLMGGTVELLCCCCDGNSYRR